MSVTEEASTDVDDARPWDGWSNDEIVAAMVRESREAGGELPVIADIRWRARAGSDRARKLRGQAEQALAAYSASTRTGTSERYAEYAVPTPEGARTDGRTGREPSAVPPAPSTRTGRDEYAVPGAGSTAYRPRTDGAEYAVPATRTPGEYASDQGRTGRTGDAYRSDGEPRTDEIPVVAEPRTGTSERYAEYAVPTPERARTDGRTDDAYRSDEYAVPVESSTRTDEAEHVRTGTDEGSVPEKGEPVGRIPWLIAAAVGIGISAWNAWHFFEAEWSAPWYIRAVLCFVLELVIVAGGWEMHGAAKKGERAPRAQAIAWIASGFAVVIAVGSEGGWGLVFGVVGPVLAVVTFHQALGVEIRHATGRSRGVVAAELSERFKARLGLADDDRDAARRIRDRHAVRAGRLAARGELGKWRKRQLRRAVTKAEISRDARSRELMLAEQATLRGLDGLAKRETVAPWEAESG